MYICVYVCVYVHIYIYSVCLSPIGFFTGARERLIAYYEQVAGETVCLSFTWLQTMPICNYDISVVVVVVVVVQT